MNGQSAKHGASAVNSESTSDAMIDAALRRLNAVEAPVRLKQRVHAHLEQTTDVMEAAAAAKTARRLQAPRLRPWKIAAVSALSAACVTLAITLALPLRPFVPAAQNVSQNAASHPAANTWARGQGQTMVAGLSAAGPGQSIQSEHSPLSAYNASRIMSPAIRKARARHQHELDIANRNRKLVSFLRSLSPAQLETLRAATPEAAAPPATNTPVATGSSATGSATPAAQKSGSAVPAPQSK